MYFTGFCTYPRGGYVFISLFLSTLAALACTTYSAISCRFAVVQFTSTHNGFEDTFSPRPVETGVLIQYRAAIGLFHWLRPISFDVGFTEGSCAGYQSSMLEAISEPYFDAARGAAVVAFLLNALAFLWVWTTTSIQYKSFPALILFTVCISGSVANALTFLLPFRAELCYGGILPNSVCHVDQAALVMAAASLFGMVGAVTVFTYLVDLDIFLPTPPPPPPPSKGRRHRRIPVDLDDEPDIDMEVSSIPRRILFPAMNSLSASERERRKRDEMLFTIDHSEPTETEVYIRSRLDRIEKVLAQV